MSHPVRIIRAFPTPEALTDAAAREIGERIMHALAGNEATFSIALSGGGTPRPVYERLAELYGGSIAWDRVRIFWGDERYVPRDAPESNYRMAREAMLDRLPIPPENIHPIPTDRADPDEAARAYESTLRAELGPEPAFDLLLLGIGADGHTASLFPGDAALHEERRLVAVTHAPSEPATRITLTFPMLRRARATLFLVAGEEKRKVIEEIADDPDEARRRYPAAMLDAEGEELWLIVAPR